MTTYRPSPAGGDKHHAKSVRIYAQHGNPITSTTSVKARRRAEGSATRLNLLGNGRQTP